MNSKQTEGRNQTDANVYIDRAIAMLKDLPEIRDSETVAGYNGVVSLLQYAKESHTASLPSKPVGDVGEMATMIVSAFPGTGKSYFVEHSGLKCLDSDSSKFDKSNFPWNYIEHIRDNIGKYEYIFVSSHQEVRDALVASGMSFLCVYPDISCRREYLQRYKERGNDEKFINLIDNNWQDWIEDIASSHIIPSIKLTKGIYVSDIFKSGYAAAPQKGMEGWIDASIRLPELDDEEAMELDGDFSFRKYVARFEENVISGFDRAGLYTAKELREIKHDGYWEWLDESPSPSEAGDAVEFAEWINSDDCYFSFSKHDGIWYHYADAFPMTTADLYQLFHQFKNSKIV